MKEQSPKEQSPKVVLKEMPDKETLEAFLESLHGEVKVVYDSKQKILRWHKPEDNPNHE